MLNLFVENFMNKYWNVHKIFEMFRTFQKYGKISSYITSQILLLLYLYSHILLKINTMVKNVLIVYENWLKIII